MPNTPELHRDSLTRGEFENICQARLSYLPESKQNLISRRAFNETWPNPLVRTQEAVRNLLNRLLSEEGLDMVN